MVDAQHFSLAVASAVLLTAKNLEFKTEELNSEELDKNLPEK